MGETVVCCGNSPEEIKKALSTAVSREFMLRCRKAENPYEKEGTSDTIVREIKKYLEKNLNYEKDFYDIEFELEEQI